MNENVKIGSYHMFDNFGLVLSSKYIGSPEIKTIEVEVPGRNGKLDLTDKLYGGQVYGNRQIKLEFQTNKRLSDADYDKLESDINNAIHGKRLRIIFDNDSNYYYYGRCIADCEVDGRLMAVNIEVDAEPYKTHITNGSKKL